MSSRLDYVLRVRDLVHGFVNLTAPEVEVINNQLFQRLRHVRQNDVAFFVYPSLNISRFEHSLGCAHVAGKMAKNLTRSHEWKSYRRAVGLSEDDLVQACRLYALLHDVGHLPLSHLFEMAFEDYAFTKDGGKTTLQDYCKEWFGGEGFGKLHEACGSALAPEILMSTSEISTDVRDVVLQLMQSKTIALDSPLQPIKLLIDSEIDADRIDATARDGTLAGQEYGNYDIERLCSSVFVQKRGPSWRLAYSHKALGSIEGLLFDRSRTHNWIHFHHRVVATKVAARVLVADLLGTGDISPKTFPIKAPDQMALRDDVWIWNKLREVAEKTIPDQEHGAAHRACIQSLLYRQTKEVCLLWKNRTEYAEVTKLLIDKLTTAALASELVPVWFGRAYEKELSREFGIRSIVFWLNFKPVSDRLTPITDEEGQHDRGHLLQNSPIVKSLRSMWKGEAQFYIVLLGHQIAPNQELETLRQKWVDFTFAWIQQVRRP